MTDPDALRQRRRFLPEQLSRAAMRSGGLMSNYPPFWEGNQEQEQYEQREMPLTRG